MSRATRRRGAAAERMARRQWERDVTQFHAENGGLLTLELLPLEAIWREPDRVVPLLVTWLRQALACLAGMLCLTCDQSVQPPALPMALLVATGPATEPAQKGLVSGICEQCARRSDAEVMRDALA